METSLALSAATQRSSPTPSRLPNPQSGQQIARRRKGLFASPCHIRCRAVRCRTQSCQSGLAHRDLHYHAGNAKEYELVKDSKPWDVFQTQHVALQGKTRGGGGEGRVQLMFLLRHPRHT